MHTDGHSATHTHTQTQTHTPPLFVFDKISGELRVGASSCKVLTSVLCSHCVVYLLSNEEVPVPPVHLPRDNRTLTHTDIYRQLGPA